MCVCVMLTKLGYKICFWNDGSPIMDDYMLRLGTLKIIRPDPLGQKESYIKLQFL